MTTPEATVARRTRGIVKSLARKGKEEWNERQRGQNSSNATNEAETGKEDSLHGSSEVGVSSDDLLLLDELNVNVV